MGILYWMKKKSKLIEKKNSVLFWSLKELKYRSIIRKNMFDASAVLPWFDINVTKCAQYRKWLKIKWENILLIFFLKKQQQKNRYGILCQYGILKH